MNGYRTQTEAIKAERQAVWGETPFRDRECVVPAPAPHVLIGRREFVIHFDNYGRLTALGVTSPEVARTYEQREAVAR